MRSSEYAGEVAEIVGRLESRIMGVGAEQYDEGDRQRFESRSLDQIIEDALEEIEDLIAYACQLHIRVRGIRDVLPQ